MNLSCDTILWYIDVSFSGSRAWSIFLLIVTWIDLLGPNDRNDHFTRGILECILFGKDILR